MKIKKAIKTMLASIILPPAADQPISTGTAPVRDPGTTAKGLSLLR